MVHPKNTSWAKFHNKTIKIMQAAANGYLAVTIKDGVFR